VIHPPPPPSNTDNEGASHSKKDLDQALADCILGEKDGCTLFYNRLAERCLEKVQHQVRKEISDVSDGDLEMYAQEALGDLTLHASQGKLDVQKSYTLYLAETLLNKIRAFKRRKKGHEVPFSVVGESQSLSRSATTTLFINTLIAPGKRPEQSAIERELLRRVGEQVGGLSVGLRDVITRVREGLNYRVIAIQLHSVQATVKAQFWQGVETLKQSIGNSGILNPATLPANLRGAHQAPRSLDGIASLLQELPTNVAIAVSNLHLEGMQLDDISQILGEPRATTEALILHGYWLLRIVTGKTFPRDFLVHLPPHPHYDHHQVRFRHW
jgi:DNA-directed RNA polymerase specialized sigma24 family protein